MAKKRVKVQSRGYTYEEVKREVLRRRNGEYRLSVEAANEALKRGMHILNIKYRLASVLRNFMKIEKISIDDLVTLYGEEAKDIAEEVLCPFPHTDHPITMSSRVDDVYPGQEHRIERD